MHRQQHLQAALQSHCYHSDSILAASDKPPIHRRPHRLHCGRDTAQCYGHLLLDLLHVHDPQQVGGKDRQRHRAARRCLARGRPGRGEASQVLSVGVLRALLPSHVVLHTALPVEDVGGRSHQNARSRSQLSCC